MTTVEERLHVKQVEYDQLRGELDIAKAKLRDLKVEISELHHLKRAADKLTPEEAKAIGLTVVNGLVVQELPDG